MSRTIDEHFNVLEVWWAIRLSSFDSLSIETTKRMLEPYKYIVSEEGDGITTKYHQHIILVYDTDTEGVRKLIKQTYPECQGNKCIYIKASKDKRQLAKYTLKEGLYCYKGFSKEYIEDAFKCSKPKTDLKKDMTENEDKFILGKIELLQFTKNYINLKVKHGQPLYMNHIEAYIRKMACQQDERQQHALALIIVERILG
jgi:hypothetical protein